MSAPKGGKRPGAGRPKGKKNKRSEELLAKLLDNGDQTPLEFMLDVMREFDRPIDIRLEAAKAAAPYVHSRLSTVDVNAKVANVTQEQALDMLDEDETEDAD